MGEWMKCLELVLFTLDIKFEIFSLHESSLDSHAPVKRDESW
jgi:hypothetical protein